MNTQTHADAQKEHAKKNKLTLVPRTNRLWQQSGRVRVSRGETK